VDYYELFSSAVLRRCLRSSCIHCCESVVWPTLPKRGHYRQDKTSPAKCGKRLNNRRRYIYTYLICINLYVDNIYIYMYMNICLRVRDGGGGGGYRGWMCVLMCGRRYTSNQHGLSTKLHRTPTRAEQNYHDRVIRRSLAAATRSSESIRCD
jgi:hypothetical protein